MDDWRAAFAELEAGTGRLFTTLSRLTDADLREPSLLPGWSRGHVATHLARNADSYSNLLDWARTGVETPQYPSLERREADLTAGAGRSSAELLEDVRAAAERFAARVRTLPEPAWRSTVRAFHGWEHPACYTVHRRRREVETHHADLDAGYSDADWPESYVRWELTGTLAWLRERGGLDASRVRATDLDVDVRLGGEGPEIEGTARALVVWLSGRGTGADLTGGPLPAPPTWPQAPATDRRST
jgi:maleylpyruvate isomerase